MSIGMRIANAYIEIRANLAPLGAGLAKARTMVQNNLNDVFKLSKSMSSIGGMVGGAALGFGIKAAVTRAADFEHEMLRARGNFRMLGDEFNSQFAELTAFAKRLGATTEFTALQAAEALNRLGKSGFNAKQAMEALPGMMSLASASQTDLTESTRIAAGVLNAFGLKAREIDRVADVLASTASRSMTDVRGLGAAFSKSGALANVFGFELEEVAALLGAMSKTNVGAAESGTALAIFFARMSQKPKQTADALDRMGISLKDFTNAAGEVDDGFGLLKAIQDAKGKGIEGVESIMDIIGARGKAIAPLFTVQDEATGKIGIDFVEALTEGIRGDTGFAKAVQENMLTGFKGQMTLFKSAVEGAAEAIGSALFPTIRAIVAPLKLMMQMIASMGPVTKRWVGFLMSAVAISGTLAFVLPYAVKAVQALGLAFKVAMGPWGWALIALGGIVALFAQIATESTFIEAMKRPLEELGKAWQRLTEAVNEATGGLIDLNFGSLWDGLVSGVTSFVVFFVDMIRGAVNFAAAIWEQHGAKIRSILIDVTSTMQALGEAAVQIWNNIAEALAPLGIELDKLIENTAYAFIELVGYFLDFIKYLSDGFAFFTADFNATWELFTKSAAYAISRVNDIWTGTWANISAFFSGIMGGMTSLMTRFLEDATFVFGSIDSMLRATVAGVRAAISAMASGGDGAAAFQNAFSQTLQKTAPKGKWKGGGGAFEAGFNKSFNDAMKGKGFGPSGGSKVLANDIAKAIQRMEDAQYKRRLAIEKSIAKETELPEEEDIKKEAEEKAKAEDKVKKFKPEFSGVVEMWKKVQNDLFKDKEDADERAAKAAEKGVAVNEEQRDILVDIRDMWKSTQSSFG